MLNSWKYTRVLLFASVLPFSGGALAHWPTARVNVEIYDRSEGRVLPIYEHGGRRYVVGKPGNEYAIRVRNNSGERALAVMSVDGVNIITGDTASPAQSGYVLGPAESADIAGWRTDISRTAAFYFTTLADSYATRTGRPDNLGVIGVAVFLEKRRPPLALGRMERDRQDAPQRSAKAASADAAMPASPPAEMQNEQAQAKQKLGTGYGRTENSNAQYTTFQRASESPIETIAIYYDSYQNLLAQGVPVGTPPLARLSPNPFPERNRFVPAPR
ncbi:MAG: hypothetical protein ABI537_00295 [Casimicrobiaceae bacterium]